MEKKKILLVDDDEIVCNMVTNLMQYDCDCVIAKNGVEGIACLEDHPGEIDVIITDLVMPMMDGFEMISCIQEKEAFKSIPILIITSLTGKDDIKRAFDMGVDDIVEKPFDPEIIKRRIKNMLELADSRMIHNVMEDLVRVEIEENIDTLGICPCPICRKDLMTLTLNNVPPKYVSTEKGALISTVTSRSREERIKILAEVAHYAEMVRSRPRHS